MTDRDTKQRLKRYYLRSLFEAIADKDVEDVCALLEEGTDPNGCESVNDIIRPLDYAVFTNSVDAIEPLIRHGADVHLKNSQGMSAYEYARESDNDEIMDVMDRCVCLVNEKDKSLIK